MNRLAVHPDWQRKGVASSLLEEMERRFDERGILVVCALVQEANARSRALFTGAGYQEDRGVIYCSKRKRPEV
jgi:ribosomal protein S18 acetylase RimI-like enzyme